MQPILVGKAWLWRYPHGYNRCNLIQVAMLQLNLKKDENLAGRVESFNLQAHHCGSTSASSVLPSENSHHLSMQFHQLGTEGSNT